MRRLWCELAWLPAGMASGVAVTLDDGLIATVVSDVAPAAGDELLAGLTLPGFANGHSHAFHRALRGRTHGGAGDFWTWREQMYRVAGRLTPDNYLALARATFAEMVQAGYTCVGEFHYVHHQPGGGRYDDPNELGLAVIEAAHSAGIRLTLLDTCYLRGGFGQELTREQRRFSDGSAMRWAERVELVDGRAGLVLGAAIHSVRAVDAPSMAVVAKHAAQRSMPLHAHVSEQLAENEQAAAEFGCSPTAILAQQGVLSERFTAVHATHLAPGDFDLYSMARCSCCLCPTTERDLADGIGPAAALRDARVALTIGSDQHAVIDPFEEVRGVELDERLRSLRRGSFAPAELLEIGAANGYRSLGWPNGGVIEVGGLADLCTVSLESARLAGLPAESAHAAVVFGATSADVHNVIVGGRTVVRDAAHVSLDVAGELRAAIASVHEESQ